MNRSNSHPIRLCIASLTLFGTLIAARAQTEAPLGTFYTPSYRGQAGTESALWDDSSSATSSGFTNANGINNATFAASGGSTLANASVTQTTPGAFLITGASPNSGDIYSFSSTSTFVLNYSVLNLSSFPNGIGNVIFQTETTGTELDYSSIQLSYTTGSGTETLLSGRDELYRSTGDFGGFGESSDVVSAWEWNLPLGDVVTSFSITFNGAGTSVALERTVLDVAGVNEVTSVPEPSTLALTGLGGAGLLFWTRRVRSQAAL